jgi:hypothetical protein
MRGMRATRRQAVSGRDPRISAGADTRHYTAAVYGCLSWHSSWKRGSGDNVLIGGIITSKGLTKVVVRAIGPILANFGITNPLLDPTLELFDDSGTPIATNDDWQTSQKSLIEETTLAPSDARESAIFAALRPGNYTAVVRGKNGATGIAVVEAYNIAVGSGE